MRLDALMDVRREERGALALGFTAFFTLTCGYAVLKPLRDALGLAGGVRSLPWLFWATFAAALVAVPAYSALVARWPRRRVIPAVYHFFALHLLGFFLLLKAGVAEAWVARAFYVWVSVFNLLVVSVFWSLLTDVLDSGQGKRLFALVAAGGTVGNLVGSGLTALLAAEVGPAHLLLLTALLLEASVLCVRALTRWAHARGPARPSAPAPGGPVGGSAWAGLRLVLTRPHLLTLGVHTLLYSTTSTFLYFLQLRLVEGAAQTAGARTELFARVELATQALTLLLQTAVAGRVLSRFGLPVGLGFVPALTLLGFVALALLPGLGVPALGLLLVVTVLRRATHYALEKPAREVLFTRVDREERYKSKSAIDTLVYRLGDSASASLNGLLGALQLPVAATAGVAAPFALAWLGVALLLGREPAPASEPAVTAAPASPLAEPGGAAAA
jgi:AAA family ATP:ADP antiporter